MTPTHRELLRGFLIAALLSFGPTVSNSFARFAYALVLPAMREDLALNYAQAGWLNTANAMGYLAGAVIIRLVVARTGNRALFAFGMVLTALALWATGFTRDLGLLAWARGLSGVGGALIFVCGGALSGNIFPQRPELGTATILLFFAGAGTGLMLCGVGMPLALEAWGNESWPWTWRVMGMISLAMALASIFAAYRVEEPQRAAGSAHWRLRPFAAELAAYVCFGLGYIGYMTFIIAWMRENGSSTGEVIAVWFLLGLATLVAPAVWTRPCDRWSGGRPLAAILGVLAVGSVLPVISVAPMVLVISALLFGVAMFSAPSAIGAFVRRSLPKPAWGSAMATFTIAFAASQIGGPVATGWVADQFGSLRPGLVVSAVVLAVGAVLALSQRSTLQPAADTRA